MNINMVLPPPDVSQAPQPTQVQAPADSAPLPQSLQGKVIAITGAASGIGLAVALACAARGATLALSDLNLPVLTSAVDHAIRTTFPDASIHLSACNVASSSSVDSWVASVITEYGRLDGACNVAGVGTKPGLTSYQPITEITDEKWKFINEVNLDGTFYCMRAQIRVMGRGGSIVNTASTAGLKGAPRLSAYSATKFGVVGLTKTVAKEVGPAGLRVNAVCPGPIETPLLKQLIEDGGGAPMMDRLSDLPLRRLGVVDEVAKGFCYLLSDESSWTTGTTLVVDGGATA